MIVTASEKDFKAKRNMRWVDWEKPLRKEMKSHGPLWQLSQHNGGLILSDKEREGEMR